MSQLLTTLSVRARGCGEARAGREAKEADDCARGTHRHTHTETHTDTDTQRETQIKRQDRQTERCWPHTHRSWGREAEEADDCARGTVRNQMQGTTLDTDIDTQTHRHTLCPDKHVAARCEPFTFWIRALTCIRTCTYITGCDERGRRQVDRQPAHQLRRRHRQPRRRYACNAAVYACNAALYGCNAACHGCDAAIYGCNAAVYENNAAVYGRILTHNVRQHRSLLPSLNPS
eukprot:592996-Rhodomonas_salina.1